MAVKGNWEDKFNPIVKTNLSLDGNKEWKFQLEEHTTKGTMQMNVRLWQHAKEEGSYEGPTKNGFIVQVKSLEDIENLEKAFAEFFKQAKEML